MTNPTPPDRKRALFSLLFAGILPVIAFTVIEDQYGTVAGILAGMVFGVGEIIWEWVNIKKVSALTWGGNALILIMGGISLISNEGFWFKLQPAILEGVMTLTLWVSAIMKKPLLVVMAEKQNGELNPVARKWLAGFTVRIGFFFAVHCGLAVWAALAWTTAQWALLKGVGLTVSMILYMLIEVMIMRRKMLKTLSSQTLNEQGPTL